MYNIVIYLYALCVAIVSLFNEKVRKMWRGEREAFRILKEQVVHAWIEEQGYKLGNIMNAWRLTLVGEGKGPGMFDISAFLGKEETLRRMQRAIETLK